MTDSKDDTIKCNKSQISFISPALAKILSSDPTISHFELTTPNSSKCSELLRSLMNGDSITVQSDLIKTFRSISIELENEEMFSFVDEGLTTENVIEITRIKHIKSFNIEREIEFIASHFYHFDSKSISFIDLSTIDSILRSESLVVWSEHKLFSLLCDLLELCGCEFLILLTHLHLEYLDLEDINKFFKLIEESDANMFLSCIHRHFVISQSVKKPEISDKRFGIVSIPFKNDKFEGIFSHLTKEINGNPVTKGVVGIEVINMHSRSNVDNLVDHAKRNQTDWFCMTTNEEGGAFIIDFKNKRVSLNGYSMKTNSYERWGNLGHMKAWKVDGSNDKTNWTIVDERKSDVFKPEKAEGHFSCEKSAPFRFFRIMMTERDTRGDYYMGIHALELFGSILDENLNIEYLVQE